MPRLKHTDPPRRVSFTIPESVLAELDLALFDPVKGRAEYGARSNLVTALLRAWLKQRAANPTPERYGDFLNG